MTRKTRYPCGAVQISDTYSSTFFFFFHDARVYVRSQQASEQDAQLQQIDERTRSARDEAKRRKAQMRRQRLERGGGVGG